MTAIEDAQHELALARAPSRVSAPIEMIRARKNKGAAFTLACDCSGLDDKEIYGPLHMDKAVFSRIKSGSVCLDNNLIADFCKCVGNTIYPEWIAYQVGCTLVVIKSEAERRAEAATARADDLERKLAFATELLQGRRA